MQTTRWHSTCAELLRNLPTSTAKVVAWIGRGGTIACPPRSHDLTPLDISVWGCVNVFVPPLLASLEELRARITEAVATIDADMIHRIWDKIAYRWDICRMTRGYLIEHL